MGLRIKYIVVLQSVLALSSANLAYPNAVEDQNVVDNYFGTKVPDPYRWLENVDSLETRAFVEEQMQLTSAFMAKSTQKDSIREKLTQFLDYPTRSTIIKAGGRYFRFEKAPHQENWVLYAQDSLDAPRQKVFDTKELAPNGSFCPYSNSHKFSRDGEIFAYETKNTRDDSRAIQFRKVATGRNLDDKLEDGVYPNWSVDNKGVFYTRLPKEKRNSSRKVPRLPNVYYHVLGTDQSEDILIARFTDHPEYTSIKPRVTDDGQYLTLLAFSGSLSENAVHVASLREGIDETIQSRIVPVYPSATEALYRYVGHEGSTFVFLTNKDAPNSKLITVTMDFSHSHRTHHDSDKGSHSTLTSTFLPESLSGVIVNAKIVDGDKLLIVYKEEMIHTLELRGVKTGAIMQKVDIPRGQIALGNRVSHPGISISDRDDHEVFFALDTVLSPQTIIRCDFGQHNARCKERKELSVSHTDPRKFVIEDVLFTSSDGTPLTLKIFRRKDTLLDGSAPALLRAYGGYFSATLPIYSAKTLTFVENFNGIAAFANIRGGGDSVKGWDKLRKQKGFDDYISAAEYLVSHYYTSSSKLVIEGFSGGGLLVAACLNQRPDLFGAVISESGVLDVLRLSKTAGSEVFTEYGVPDSKKKFETLSSYSPLQNIRVPSNDSVVYPAVLVTTYDQGARIPPSQSYKYIAELQNSIGRRSGQTNPLLLLVEKNAGSSGANSRKKEIDEATSILSFIAEVFKIESRVTT